MIYDQWMRKAAVRNHQENREGINQMAIAPIETLSNNAAQGSTSANDAIDKNEFLLLLVTQLKNQDPLNPMEYAEFTSQTAQFAALEQLQAINENLGSLQKYQSALFDEHAVSFIGKKVKVSDNTVDLKANASEELHFELEKEAREVYAYVYDATGSLVKEIAQTGSFSAGEQSLTWDGTDDDGNRVSEGRYSFEVKAVDSSGTTFTGEPFYEAVVTSVNYGDGTAYITAGNRDISVGNILKITGS